MLIQACVKYATDVFGSRVRSSGREYEGHIRTVLEYLWYFGASTELLIAGTFHDLLEMNGAETRKRIESEIRLRLYEHRRKLELCYRDHIRAAGCQLCDGSSCIGACIGERVIQLVTAVTEPRGAHVTWRQRKEHFLTQMRAGDHEMVLLGAVLKIEALNEAIAVHARGLPTTAWSQAGLEENLWFFRECREIFVEKQLPEELLELFNELIEEFRQGPPQTPKIAA